MIGSGLMFMIEEGVWVGLFLVSRRLISSWRLVFYSLGFLIIKIVFILGKDGLLWYVLVVYIMNIYIE